MKKSNFLKIVKRKVQHKTLMDLNKLKQSHSKVMDLKHEVLKMKQYLMPNNLRMNKEDGQMIFKLRCRVTETKMNMKGMYDEHDCRACGKINENQEHIIQCEEILQINKEYENIEIPEYEKIQNGDVSEQLLISKIFTSNMKVIEKIEKGNKNK